MEATSQFILNFNNRKEEELSAALTVGFAKVKAFFDEKSHGIPEDVFAVAYVVGPTEG